MGKPVIYLASVASSCREMLAAMDCAGAADLIDYVQSAVGDAYLVEGDAALIEAQEDDERGGRSDDVERAEALERRLADEETVALVALRGGAWVTRILRRIDFEVLARRRRRIAVFGFSELTTVLNIASAYPQAFCLYDLCPGFLRKGLRDFARRHPDRLTEAEADQRVHQQLAAFFRDVQAVLEGRGSSRSISGTLVAGRLSGPTRVQFVGGNLTVVTTLLGTRYAQCIDPAGRWLVIEDINESPDRIDRRLAHLKLAGFFQRCAGLLIGDFHAKDKNHQAAVVQLLQCHLPPGRDLPVVSTRDVGHVWPVAPLPLNSPVVLEPLELEQGQRRVRFEVSWPMILAGRGAE